MKFLSRGSQSSLFLSAAEAVLASREGWVLRTELVGAHRDTLIEGMEPMSGHSNYLVGNDAAKWHRNVSNYSRVRYTNAYTGIDMIYRGNGTGFE